LFSAIAPFQAEAISTRFGPLTSATNTCSVQRQAGEL
jgi:hypothetical protein